MSRRRPFTDPDPDQVEVAVVGGGAAGVQVARAAAAALAGRGAGRSDGRSDGTNGGTSDGRTRGRVLLVSAGRPGGGSRLVADGGVLLECAVRGLDWHATLAHLRTVRSAVEDRCREAALRADGVELVTGRARLLGGGRLAIEAGAPGRRPGLSHPLPVVEAPARTPTVVTARSIVLATGDEERLPDVDGLADTRCLTATSLLGLGDLPPSIAVLGGGPDGCELAQALARFGVQVTLVEAADRLLPNEHPDASSLVTAALREDGVRVFTGSPVVKVAPTLDGGAWLGTAAGGDVAAEGLLLAAGRRAAVRDLDLAAAGVRLSPGGWVAVDDRLRTGAAGVLAAGRVTGLLPHGTTDPVMAQVAGENAVARRPRSVWREAAPARVVRTEPAVAVVGLDPDRAGEIIGARVSVLPYRGLERALLADRPAGLVTLVVGPASGGGRFRRRPIGTPLLGVSVIGPQAGELAGVAAMALRSGVTVEQLARTPLSSRTWGSALQHAAAGFDAR